MSLVQPFWLAIKILTDVSVEDLLFVSGKTPERKINETLILITIQIGNIGCLLRVQKRGNATAEIGTHT